MDKKNKKATTTRISLPINVTINGIHLDAPGPNNLPMAEFTVELGWPQMILKGTFSEWTTSPTKSQRTGGNLSRGYSDGFAEFLRVCEQQTASPDQPWTLVKGMDFRNAIMDALDQALASNATRPSPESFLQQFLKGVREGIEVRKKIESGEYESE